MNMKSSCYPLDLLIVIIFLAFIDGVLAFVAFSQLTRIHVRNQQAGWTRQKVLHLMIGCSNLGYSTYFISTIIATCNGWLCWSHACGFIFMAFPKILFLAAFLLLLSFWVDLCHQANDDDDDDGENSNLQPLLDSSKSTPNSSHGDGHWRCFSFHSIHIGSRQKFVTVVVMVIFILMVLFAVIIWFGAGKNPIDSLAVARVYIDLFSIAILILGGALGCYE
uniref:THH1/TOM1/TOM3 domain-containing protein n=1 Tax=Rhizophora mucronata TaxID=61149 RepID=A0A2P2KI66_RHIMU